MKTICMIGMVAVAAISFGSEPIGYLAKIGPAPLRFQSAPKGPDVTVILPPVKMSEPPAVKPAVPPKMLLHFLNRTSTNHDTSLLLPYQFNPPVAPIIPAPPSKAT